MDFLVNTGLYVVRPDVIKLIPNNKYYDFRFIKQGKKIKVK